MKPLRLAFFALFCTFFCFLHGNWAFSQENPVSWTFKVVHIADDQAELQFTALIKEKWHLYAQSHNNGIELPTVFEFGTSADYKRVGKVVEPTPKVQYNPPLSADMPGDTAKFFDKKVTFKQKIKILTPKPFQVKGRIHGQACIDGRCVAFEEKFSFDVEGAQGVVASETDLIPADTAAAPNDSAGEATASTETMVQTAAETASTSSDDSLLRYFIFAFLGGLAGLLTPCVFPMIPMTTSYFMKMGDKAKRYAMFYGGSIVVIYLVFGIALSLIFGASFSNIVSTHWLPNVLFALIFVVFAISMFGYFEFRLPSKWVNSSAKMESRGGLVGVFFMALTLVLVSFSCTLPLAGAVALNAADGSIVKPIIGMLGFSLAFAIPFTFFAFFPNLLKKLPKSGSWMNTVKVVLAFVELAFALKFLNVPDQAYHWGILDREIYLACWIVLFAMLGFYLLGKLSFPLDDKMEHQSSPVRFILAIVTFTFVVYLIPGMFGAPLKSISGWLPPMTTQDFDINQIVRSESNVATADFSVAEAPKYADKLHLPHGMSGYFDYDQALHVAEKLNKPVFIDFTGHGCVNCRNVENAVWIDKRVRELLANEFVVVALYVDEKVIQLSDNEQLTDEDGDPITTLGGKNRFIQHTIYHENSQPCYFVVDPQGNVLNGPLGYELNIDHFLAFLQKGIDAFHQK